MSIWIRQPKRLGDGNTLAAAIALVLPSSRTG
jgi:hypothetical protein